MTPDSRQTRIAHRALCGVSWLLLVALSMGGQTGGLDRLWLAGQLAQRITAGVPNPLRALVQRTQVRSEAHAQREHPGTHRSAPTRTHHTSLRATHTPGLAQRSRPEPLPFATLALPPPASVTPRVA